MLIFFFFCRQVLVIDLAKQARIFMSIETAGAAVAAGKSPLLTTYSSTMFMYSNWHW